MPFPLQLYTLFINKEAVGTAIFTYDSLNRLLKYGNDSITYDVKGNILTKTDAGTYQYTNTAKPYAVTALAPASNSVPLRAQTVTYTSLQRPATITENGYTATFTYDDEGNRMKEVITHNSAAYLTKYYIGGIYEKETNTSNTIERLYLEGDYYSAPMVLTKTGTGSWILLNILRDYQGSILKVTNSAGTTTNGEYSYDAWGRMRNPSTWAVYAVGSEPNLFLGRGYTGHEHLPMFGLINMNARLYDPVLGRFLAPDPYVQASDFSQSYNRYGYCMNNPMKYVDEDGEFFLGYASGFLHKLLSSGNPIKAIEAGWKRGVNEMKILFGLVNTGSYMNSNHRNLFTAMWELTSRFTWQLPQTLVGFNVMEIANLAGQIDKVDYWGGATVASGNNWNVGGAVTIGNYIMGSRRLAADPNNSLFQHEYGHYLQSQTMGLAFLLKVGIPSLTNAMSKSGNHDYQPYEQDANRRAFVYMNKHVEGFYQTEEEYYDNLWKKIRKGWNFNFNPLDIYHTQDYFSHDYRDYKDPETIQLINNNLKMKKVF